MDEQEKNGIDFMDLLKYLKNKIWIILVALVVFAMGTFIVSKFIVKPKYESLSRIYILKQANQDNVVNSDIQLSQELLNDYKVLLTSDTVMIEVIDQLDLDMEPGQLQKMITITSPPRTRVVEIHVKDTDAQRATDIANTIWSVGAESLKNIMKVDVNLIDEARLPKAPSSPNVLTNTIIGAIIGLFGAIIVLAIIFITDDKIKKEEDVKYYLGITTMGTIPFVKDDDSSKKEKE